MGTPHYIRHIVKSLTTDGSGDASEDLVVAGVIRKIFIDLGTLTTPNVTIIDKDTGETILGVTGVAADTPYQVKILAKGTNGSNLTGDHNIYTLPCATTVTITIASGGNITTGEVEFYLD